MKYGTLVIFILLNSCHQAPPESQTLEVSLATNCRWLRPKALDDNGKGKLWQREIFFKFMMKVGGNSEHHCLGQVICDFEKLGTVKRDLHCKGNSFGDCPSLTDCLGKDQVSTAVPWYLATSKKCFKHDNLNRVLEKGLSSNFLEACPEK